MMIRTAAPRWRANPHAYDWPQVISLTAIAADTRAEQVPAE
jgi:hypothetical protein